MNGSASRKWWLFAAVTAAGCVLDIVSKHLCATYLPYGRPVPLLGDYVQLLLVFNKGGIFGINPQRFIPGLPMNLMFIVFNFLAMTILVVYYSRLNARFRSALWGVSLIMPGAIGNVFDRIVRPGQGVVDFIRLGISERIYWPIFNFADAYVTFGVALLLLSFVLEEKTRAAAPSGRSSADPAPGNGPVSS